MPHSERSVLGEDRQEHLDVDAQEDRREREERLDVPEDQREMVRR